MEQVLRRHSLFELAVIVILVFAASWPAFSLSVAGLLPLLHALFLISAYLLVRLLVGRLNKWVGKLVFSVTFLLLLADIVIQRTIGLHLNLFVFSVMLQPDVTQELGISGAAAYGSILLLLGAGLLAARSWKEPAFELKGRELLLMAAMTGLSSQLLYGVMYFKGAAQIEETRRMMPFFTAPHPYRSGKVLGLFMTKDSENPFALEQVPETVRSHSTLLPKFEGSRKNVLLVVIDSLRAQDVRDTPSLMPSLYKWSGEGTLTFDYYSVSNCTHFSFYSLYTGALPTGFGSARRGTGIAGILPNFAANNYAISTAESNSLNWYDTSKIIFPESTQRLMVRGQTQTASDSDVTRQSIAYMNEQVSKNQPFFHLAYYFGPHYPYDSEVGSESDTTLDRYYRTLRTVDNELDSLLTWMSGSGLLKSTIVIVTGDHGEEFRNDGAAGHATRLTDAQIKVPLLVIDQTVEDSPVQLQSHRDIAPYIMARLNEQPVPEPQPVILANCSYDFPSGFALVTNEGRFDFTYDDGYLTPAPSPDGTLPPRHVQLEAAGKLVRAIKKGAEERPQN